MCVDRLWSGPVRSGSSPVEPLMRPIPGWHLDAALWDPKKRIQLSRAQIPAHRHFEMINPSCQICGICHTGQVWKTHLWNSPHESLYNPLTHHITDEEHDTQMGSMSGLRSPRHDVGLGSSFTALLIWISVPGPLIFLFLRKALILLSWFPRNREQFLNPCCWLNFDWK